jgi:hypothetical protein
LEIKAVDKLSASDEEDGPIPKRIKRVNGQNEVDGFV